MTVQLSAERGGILAGTDEAIAILKLGCDDWTSLLVHALGDGEKVEAWETVMTIDGPYDLFAHLTPLCLGVLSRRSRVATNARRFADAARPKPVMVFPSRHDHWLMQAGDAHAAFVGGAASVSGASPPGTRGAVALATLPHALIAAGGGSTVEAARLFAAHVPESTQIVVPVDYENDAVGTSLEVARALDSRLWGVQLATGEHLVDRSIIPEMGIFPPTGVNPQLVWHVRNALDAEGLGDVRLLVSGGVTLERIRLFEEDGVPVDAYGVGAAIYGGSHPFSADIVAVDGTAQARAGREARPNARMERVK